MDAVVLGAVRTRTAQSLTVLIVAALIAAAASAGSWYSHALATKAATAVVDAAPPDQRVLSVSQPVTTGGDPRGALDAFAATVDGLLPVTGGDPVLGLTRPMYYRDPLRAGAGTGLAAAYRDGFCSHVRLTGTCPAGAGQAAISKQAAQRIRLATGDDFEVRPSTEGTPVRFRITGVYELVDPAGAYWSDKLFRAETELDPFFTPAASFADSQPGAVYDLEVPAALLREDDGGLSRAQATFDAAQLKLNDPTGPLREAVRRDRAGIQRGVLIALIQVLVLGLFALGLAGRYTARDRRGDAALLKLRGSSGSGVVRLGLGQHLVPMLGGALLGWPAGFLAAWLLARGLPARPLPALELSAAAVGAVVVAGLLVLTVVDLVVLRGPVSVLLRRVRPGRRDRLALVVDLPLLAIAAGAVFQARSGRPESGLGVAAPALAALAVALVLARLLSRIADRAGGAAVRAGRLRFGLTAVQVSRQPGTDRVFALIVVAVALSATAIGGFAAARTARADRSEIELGAARVLTVRPVTATELEYAVHQADPGGRLAMGAIVDPSADPPLLAVDSSRLAAVATWRPEYAAVTTLSAATRMPAALPLITGTALTLRVRNDRAQPARLEALLQHEATGLPVRVQFGPIAEGEQTVAAPVAGCAVAPGCRLVRWQLATPPDATGRPLAGEVTIRALTQQEPAGEILGGIRLADPTAWRTDVASPALEVSTTGRGLAMAANPNVDTAPGDRVYALDTPLPLPVVLAGAPPSTWRLADPSLPTIGVGGTPATVAGTAELLPVLGRRGVLTDLESARRIAAEADLRGTRQVWLAPSAPQSIVDALQRAGLEVSADDTLAAREGRLARQGRFATATFGLFTVVVALLLAAAMVAVAAAVERAPREEQLRALRTQGLSRSAAIVIGYAATAGPVAAGLIGGLLAATLARPITGLPAAPFPDGWRLVPPPDPLSPAALAVAALLALVVLGPAGWLAVRPLVRRLRSDS